MRCGVLHSVSYSTKLFYMKGYEMNQNDLSSMLMDLYDLRRAIPKNVKAMPKDNDGSEFTIGELIDDLIEKLEQAGV